jgi:hypothetical protein
MNHQSGRLVDHHQGLVFVDDLQWNRLRNQADRFGRRRNNLNFLSRTDPMIGLTPFPLNFHMTRFDPSLEDTSTEPLELVGKEKVESMARLA